MRSNRDRIKDQGVFGGDRDQINRSQIGDKVSRQGNAESIGEAREMELATWEMGCYGLRQEHSILNPGCLESCFL